MKVLCTGSSGLIGKALCKKLEQLGHSVYSLSHIAILKYPAMVEGIRIWNPDWIFNLSAYGNHSNQTDIDEIYYANSKRTFELLEIIADIPYKAFINVGSSSEYGRKGSCMREDMVLNPDTFYGATKAAGTHLARAFAKQYNKPIITVRPFSVYGPGEAEHRFIPTVIRKIKTGEELELVEGSHDWIHVDDVVDAMIRLIPYAQERNGEVFNIGTGEEYSNSFIVKELEKTLNKKARIKTSFNMRPFDSQIWCADTTKLKSVLGWDWKPRHIITGLKELVNEN